MADQSNFPVIKVGNNGPADPSALLDLTSTTQGLLPPRMTAVQISGIATPATGLIVFNTTTQQLNQYTVSGWGAIAGGGGGGGSGTVTSVGFNDGSTNPIFNISGSPVTTAGTLVPYLKTQTSGGFFAGPISGSAAQPSFRPITSGDVPALGYVTSVAVSAGSPVLSVSGSPITTNGTISVGLAQPLSNGQAVVTNASGQFVSAVFSSTPTANALATWDGNENMFAAGFIGKLSSIATAGTTTTLTVASNEYQVFTGTSNQTVVLPTASVTSNSQKFYILNLSTGTVTVQTSGSNTLQAMASNTILEVTCINQSGGTGTASWSWNYFNYQGGPVTSVGFSDSSTTPIYTIGSTPVTGSGTITSTLNTQSAAKVFAGPISGSAAQPTFRSLVSGDIPALSYVTSIGFSDSSTTPIYAIGSSPVTSSGTITQTLSTQTANQVFAGPTGGSAAQPNFRALVSGDFPSNTIPVASVQNIAADTLLGNNTSGSAAVTALTVSQVNTLLNLASASSTYAQAHFPTSTQWSTTTTSGFVNPALSSGSATLTVDQHSGITVTAVTGNFCGFTFTPSSNTAVYAIIANVGLYQGTLADVTDARLFDGTTQIASSGINIDTVGGSHVTLCGIYAPATTSAVNVFVQLVVNGGTGYITGTGASDNSVEFTIIQINPQTSNVNLAGNVQGILPVTGGGTGFSDYAYYATLGSNQSISGTGGTLVAANTLNFPIAASETWQYDFDCIAFPTVTATGVKFGITGPTSSTVVLTVHGVTSAVGTYSQSFISATNSASLAFCTATGVTGFVCVRGTIVNSTTSGTCGLLFAPNTTSDAVTLVAGSHMKAFRIS
jgi:hypothetical protein